MQVVQQDLMRISLVLRQYDRDTNGELDQEEFTALITDLVSADGGIDAAEAEEVFQEVSRAWGGGMMVA